MSNKEELQRKTKYREKHAYVQEEMWRNPIYKFTKKWNKHATRNQMAYRKGSKTYLHWLRNKGDEKVFQFSGISNLSLGPKYTPVQVTLKTWMYRYQLAKWFQTFKNTGTFYNNPVIVLKLICSKKINLYFDFFFSNKHILPQKCWRPERCLPPKWQKSFYRLSINNRG